MARARTAEMARATPATVRRDDWLRNGVVSGFLASFGMTVVIAIAYGLANALGDGEGDQLARWFAALGDNPVTRRAADAVVVAIGLNLLVGLLWALAYARWAEPALSGPGWRKGAIFSLFPWLLSLAVFLPIIGGGFFGAEIGAGPLPILGNLFLHLVFGVILGAVYGLALDSGLDGSEADRVNAAAAERGAAIGIAAGVLVGLVLGWLVGPGLAADGDRGAATLAGALIGGAIGLAAGSFAGMGRERQPS